MSYLLDSEFIDPAQLTGFVRAALYDLDENRYTLSRFLPNVPIDDITYEFLKGGAGLAEAAVYRSYDAESPIGRREGLGKVMGELPPISEKIPLNEYDRLRLRRVTNDEILPFLTRDAERIARNIGARFEMARADALFNGSVTIAENGVIQTIAFGRNPAHNVVAGTAWSNAADSTPLTDLETWVETYTTNNGAEPGVILMSRQVFANFRRSKEVRDQAFPTSASAPSASADQARNVLAALDLPPIEIYDAQVRTNGSAARVTPSDKLALLPAPGASSAGAPTDLGATMLGTTVEALDPEYGIATGDQPGIVAATYKSTDPRRLWTHGVAIGVPILGNPDLTFVADVL